MKITKIDHYKLADVYPNRVFTAEGIRPEVKITIAKGDTGAVVADHQETDENGGVLYCRVFESGLADYGYRGKDQWWSSRPGCIKAAFDVDLVEVRVEGEHLQSVTVETLHRLLEACPQYAPGDIAFTRNDENAMILASGRELRRPKTWA
jgi:hypothetical protein